MHYLRAVLSLMSNIWLWLDATNCLASCWGKETSMPIERKAVLIHLCGCDNNRISGKLRVNPQTEVNIFADT